MNKYGLILHEIGLGGLVEDLMSEVLKPLTAMLYPEWGGASLDDFHAFTVRRVCQLPSLFHPRVHPRRLDRRTVSNSWRS